MSEAKVKRCVSDVMADFERQGGLDEDDVHRLIDGHGLNGEESAAVLKILETSGVELDRSDSDEVAFALTDSVGQMFQHAGKFQLLTAGEEVMLGRRISIGQKAYEAFPDARQGSIEAGQIADGKAAHERLVLSNLRLVASIARKYRSAGMESSDLLQEGAIGLMRAADKYDHTLGYKFSTYATWWIRQAISRGLADKGRIIRIPVHATDDLVRITGEQQRFERLNGRLPTLHELSLETDLDSAKVQALLDISRSTISLDVTVGDDSSTSIDELLNLYSADVQDEVGRALEAEEINGVLCDLSDYFNRSAKGAGAHVVDMIRLRFGFEDDTEWTLESIGDRYGVTRERVRQILDKTLGSPALVNAFEHHQID